MSDYKRIPTTYDVWKAIKAAHPCLKVFGTYSAPYNGIMETSYGFPGHDTPIMEARTTWEIHPEIEYERINEQHEYWLCFPIPQTDTIDKYEELLRESASLFRTYETSHRTRGPEHLEKAERNADIASRIEHSLDS